MSVQSTENVFAPMRHPVEMNKGVNRFMPYSAVVQDDTYSFSGGMCEDMKYSKEQSVSGAVCVGKINNKDATLKMVRDKENSYVEGIINDKQLILTDNIDSGTCYGVYGGKQFVLNIDYNKPSKLQYLYNCVLLNKTFIPDYFNINGTIGDKKIDLKLPNADIPKDEDEKDLASVLLFKNGLEARTFNGKVVQIGYSKMKKGDILEDRKERDEKYKQDVKPLIMQSISMVASVMLGALLCKIGLKN
jgi:hypothetical protein